MKKNVISLILVFFLCIELHSQYSLNDSLLGYWNFCNGTPEDISGNDYDGVLKGLPYPVCVKTPIDSGYQFVGAMAEYIEIDSFPTITENLTLSAWFKTNNLAFYDNPIFTKGTTNDYYTMWVGYDHITLLLNWSTGIEIWAKATITITDGVWYHAAAVYDYDNQIIKVYLNGNKLQEYFYDKQIVANTQLLTIGSSFPGGQEYFKGAVDELRIYNRALSDDEIHALSLLGQSLVYLGEDTVVCNSDDTITLNAGDDFISYLWHDGSTNQTFDVTAAGTYFVEAANAVGCLYRDTISISYVDFTADVDNDTCFCYGGSVTIDAGAGYDNYIWQDGSTNQTFVADTAGNYWVEITDTSGCIDTAFATVTELPELTAVISSVSNAGCGGASDGIATVSPSGGVAPYSYTWSTLPPQDSSTATGLAAGNYTATVTGYCVPGGNELVSNWDFSNGNTDFTSNYTFCPTTSGGCLYPEGTYAVGTNPNAYHSGFSACGDHTTGSGNFMILNGAGAAGVSVWCQTISIAPNTNYNFSTWITSVNPSSPAQLQFSINGNQLGDVFSAVSTCCVWLHFFTVWNSGSDTTATICIVNQNTSISGNDFGIDDISFQQCVSCSTTVSVTIQDSGVYNIQLDTAVCQGDSIFLGGSYRKSNGIYYDTLIAVSGCDSVITTDLTVNPMPSADIAADTAICNGETVTLSVSGGGVYSWNTGATTAAINVSPAITMTYTVTVNDINGCSDSDEVAVTVNPLPGVSAGADITICSGYDTTLTAAGGVSYIWNTTETNSSITVNPTISSTYSVTGTNIYGCSAVDEIIVSISPLVINAGPDVSICEGSPAIINATGGVSYLWDSGETTSSITVMPVVLATYIVTGTDIFGCTKTDSVIVTVNPLPDVNFTADTFSGCTPLTVSFSDLSAPSIQSRTWNFGDPLSGINNISDIQSPSHLFADSGSYDIYLRVVASNGCIKDTTVNDMIIVYEFPVADFTPEPDNTTILNSLIYFINQSQSATSYMWNFGDFNYDYNISYQQSPNHMYTDPGTYTVWLIAENNYGCKDSISKEVIINPDFTLYFPSAFTPDDDVVNDYFMPQGIGVSVFEMYIFNRWGECVFETKDIKTGWDGTFKNKVCPLGVYSWVIFYDNPVTGKHEKKYGQVVLLSRK